MKKYIYHFFKSNTLRIYLIFLLSLYISVANAQSVTWAFLKGFTEAAGAPVYGTMGVADPANLPGARHSSATWQIGSKLYLYGGGGVTGNNGYHNDLWEYDTDTGNWRWIKGNALTTYQAATYGTLGEPAETNSPGSRGNSVTWVSGGKLYLFGGQTYTSNNSQRLNDLWVFDPATGNWCWIKGGSSLNQNAYYGTFGVAAAPNTPGSRHSSVSWESGGKLYLFGGRNNNASTGETYNLNDLWVFDPATGNWCWIKGSSLANQIGTYGTLGVAAAANTPGGRLGSVSWESAGKLYLFGGSNGQSFNDLWEYEIGTGLWRWIKGNNATNQAGTYGTRGTAAAANTPGARYGSESWESGGKLFLFGGFGRSVSNTGTLNDLWEYSPDTGYWRWIKGSNLNGKNGTLGSIEAANQPGARDDAISWKAGGKLYLFGGSGFGLTGRSNLRGDLWSATFVSTSAALTNLTLSDGTLSPNFNSDSTNYSASVSISTANITLTPTVSDATASVTVNGVAVTSGSASQAISLSGGSNTITTVVTAQDGETTKTYTLTINRALSTNANLAALSTSSGTIDPGFDAAKLSYAASVAFATSSITVTPTLSETNATIQVKINGGGYVSITSASASAALALNVGSNTIDVKVTAQDGSTIKTYTITVTREKADQVITFNALSAKKYGDVEFELEATGGASGNPLTYVSSNPTVATVSGNTVTILSVGTSNITVSQAASANYNAAADVVQTLTVNKANQTLSFSALANKTFGDDAFSITATGGASGNPLTYVSSNPTVATVSGNTVTILSVGTSNITVSQAASANYNAAADVVQTLTVNKANQTLSFSALANKTFGDDAFSITATGGASGNPLTYVSSNPTVATVSGNTVTILSVGTSNITASQAAGANYNAAADVVQTLTVNKANQIITFNALTAKTYGDAAFDLTAIGGASGNVVSYVSSNTSVARISGRTLTLVGAGSTNITASQAGNANYIDAADVPQVLIVNKGLSAIANLSALGLSTGMLSPVFSANTTSYNVSVANNVSSVTITPAAEQSDAKIHVNGSLVNSGIASGIILLNLGSNTISTVVRAQDGTTTKTYTITMTREAAILSSLSTLSSFSLSAGTLSPAFSSSVRSYSTYVNSGISSVTISPVAGQAGATIKINGKTLTAQNSSVNIVLNAGENTITAIVTAEDGKSTNTYVVKVTRLQPEQTLPDTGGNSNLNNTTNQVIITSAKQAVTVTVAAGTSIASSISYGNLISGGTGNIPQTSINSPLANVQIPAGTVVTGSSSTWNGVIYAPKVSNYDLPVVPGEVTTVGLIIEVGSETNSLSFSKGVRLLLPGQSGMRVARVHGSVYTEITVLGSSDTQAAGDALPADGTFKINAGADLVIWTKAFSRFITFTKTTDLNVAVVTSDKDALTEDLIKGANTDLNHITTSLTNPLPATLPGGSEVTWTSSNATVISADGQTINRPIMGLPSPMVTLTATVKKGLITDTKTFNLRVLPLANQAPTLGLIVNQTAICAAQVLQSIALSGISAGPESGQTNTLSVSSNNPHLLNQLSVTSKGSTGTITYMPVPGASGTAIITAMVKDNGGTAAGGTDSISRSFTVTINPIPSIHISNSAGSSLSKGNTAVLTASGGTGYSWVTESGIISGQNSAVLTVRPVVTTSYTVKVTSAMGCTSSQNITVNVIDDYQALEAMNIMTPNGDGKNDFLVIKNLDYYPDHSLKIFDRSGRIIYQKVNYQNDWDGSFEGSPLAEGTYYYVVDFGAGKNRLKGFVSIVK
jgi:gliding motility-associated-like protein